MPDRSRFLIVVPLLLCGCPESTSPPESSPPAVSKQAPATPAEDAAPAEVPQDSQEAVAALEELGVAIKRDQSGHVVEINASEIQTELTDEHVALLAGLPHLLSVNLDYTQVSNDGLAKLAESEQIRAVSLRRCPNINDDGLVHLIKLPRLERLSLLYNSNSITDAGMVPVGKINTLRLLDLRGCTQISDEGLGHLAGLTNLVDFKIQTGAVGDDGVAHLTGMTKLKSLALEKTRVTNDGLAHLAGMTGMENLNLYLTPIDDEGLVHFKDMTRLKFVMLRDTATQGTGLVHLHPAKETLVRLDLSETFVTDEGLANVAELTNLESLNLWYSGVSDAGLTHLSGLTRLKDLNLEKCDITDAGLAEVAKLTSLTKLNLTNTDISDEGLQQLHALKNLKELQLSNTQVSDDAIAALKDAVPGISISM